jgi:hypothetical protein
MYYITAVTVPVSGKVYTTTHHNREVADAYAQNIIAILSENNAQIPSVLIVSLDASEWSRFDGKEWTHNV